MKSSTIFFLIIIVLIGVGLYQSGIHTDSVLVPDEVEEETFSGELQSVDTSCFADGVCSATVNGQIVILMQGFTGGPLGEVRNSPDGIGGLLDVIGSNVEVYAAETESGYTLYGSNDYYLEVQ